MATGFLLSGIEAAAPRPWLATMHIAGDASASVSIVAGPSSEDFCRCRAC